MTVYCTSMYQVRTVALVLRAMRSRTQVSVFMVLSDKSLSRGWQSIKEYHRDPKSSEFVNILPFPISLSPCDQ
jgi:hypothetical protein